MTIGETRMTRALVRVSLVVFLIVSFSYQSWSITVPSDSTDFRFATAHPGKLLPSLFDIDDEHRVGRSVVAAGPAALSTIHPSILLGHIHAYFHADLPSNNSTLQKSTVVLVI
ncbi:MAG TPA: hypothetical protein VF452_12755 [Candidatus Binatia bacterium]